MSKTPTKNIAATKRAIQLLRANNKIDWVPAPPGESGVLLVIRRRREEIRLDWLVPRSALSTSNRDIEPFTLPKPKRPEDVQFSMLKLRPLGALNMLGTTIDVPLHLDLMWDRKGWGISVAASVSIAVICLTEKNPNFLFIKVGGILITAGIALWVSSEPTGGVRGGGHAGVGEPGSGGGITPVPDAGGAEDSPFSDYASTHPGSEMPGREPAPKPDKGSDSGGTCGAVYEDADGVLTIVICGEKSSSSSDKTSSSTPAAPAPESSSNSESDEQSASSDDEPPDNSDDEPPDESEATPTPDDTGGGKIQLTQAEALKLIQTVISSTPASDRPESQAPQLPEEPVEQPSDGVTDPLWDSSDGKLYLSRAEAGALTATFVTPASDHPENEDSRGTTGPETGVDLGIGPIGPPDDPAAQWMHVTIVSGSSGGKLTTGLVKFNQHGHLVGVVVTGSSLNV
jgi:hypothetical protein